MWPLLFIASLIPVWRRAGVDKPLNTWEYIGTALKHPMEHISVEEAIARARKARDAGYLKGPGHTGVVG